MQDGELISFVQRAMHTSGFVTQEPHQEGPFPGTKTFPDYPEEIAGKKVVYKPLYAGSKNASGFGLVTVNDKPTFAINFWGNFTPAAKRMQRPITDFLKEAVRRTRWARTPLQRGLLVHPGTIFIYLGGGFSEIDNPTSFYYGEMIFARATAPAWVTSLLDPHIVAQKSFLEIQQTYFDLIRWPGQFNHMLFYHLWHFQKVD